MPVVFRYKGLRFFFYSNEGDPRESVHIHVRGDGGEAKLWLQPTVRVAQSDGFSAKVLRELLQVTRENESLIIEAWNEHFSQGRPL